MISLAIRGTPASVVLLVVSVLASPATAQRPDAGVRPPPDAGTRPPPDAGAPASADAGARPSGPAASPPRIDPAVEEGRLLYLSDLFSSGQWADLVVETETDTAPGEGPRAASLAPSTEVHAELAPMQRQSIDQDVLQQIIVDRSRRVAMRAVADIFGEIGGTLATRQYVQQFLASVTQLILDRTGMQNTIVEKLVGILARALIADAVVRMRFPDDAGLVDPCQWRLEVHREPRAALAAAVQQHLGPRAPGDHRPLFGAEGDPRALAACRDLPRVETECTGADTDPVLCALLGQGARASAPWTPIATGDAQAAKVRAYLVDVAFWSLGRTPLFARSAGLPSCAFADGEPASALCAFVAGGTTEEAREQRAAALVGTKDLLSGIAVAHELLRRLRPPAHLRLGAVVEALARRPMLGAFGRTRVLDTVRWREYGNELEALVEVWRAMIRFGVAVAPPAPSDSELPDADERARAAVENLDRALRRACAASLSRGPLTSVCGGPRLPPNATPPPPPRPARPGCEGVPTNLRGWTRHVLGNEQIIHTAMALRDSFPRRVALCLPGMLDTIAIRAQSNGAELAAIDGAMDVVAVRARAERTAAEGFAQPTFELERLGLRDVDNAAAVLGAPADALEALDAAVQVPELRVFRSYRDLVDGQYTIVTWPQDLDRTARGVRGLERFLRLVGALDHHVLRSDGLERLGELTHALSGFGGDVASPLISRIGPVLPYIQPDRPLRVEVMLLLLEQIPVDQIVVSLGISARAEAWCDEDETSLPCWVSRILLALREATDVDEQRVGIDSNRLVKTLGALGDDFRRRNEWRWYFHLTIGLGEMLSFLPPALSGTGRTERRFVPLMAEQIGIGYASPSFWNDSLGVRFGVFGSGFLYRIVLDSQESDALMFGGFLAVDLYEMLEVYVAPMMLLYPPDMGGNLEPSFAIAAGVQVPLGDYLSQL